MIEGKLLDRNDVCVLKDALNAIRDSQGVTLGINGGTNVLLCPICNVIVHVLLPFFIEYLRVDIKMETGENVTKWLWTL